MWGCFRGGKGEWLNLNFHSMAAEYFNGCSVVCTVLLCCYIVEAVVVKQEDLLIVNRLAAIDANWRHAQAVPEVR